MNLGKEKKKNKHKQQNTTVSWQQKSFWNIDQIQ